MDANPFLISEVRTSEIRDSEPVAVEPHLRFAFLTLVHCDFMLDLINSTRIGDEGLLGLDVVRERGNVKGRAFD